MSAKASKGRKPKGVEGPRGVTVESLLRMDESHALHLLGFLMARGTMIPELLDFFGGDTREVLRFLGRFAGVVVAIPSRETLGRWARDVNIWRSMQLDDSAATVKRLAALYGLTRERVALIWGAMRTEIPKIVEGKAPLSR